RRGERRRQRLEVGDVARLVRVVVLAARDGEAVPQTTQLDEAQVERQEEAGAEERDDDERDLLAADRDPFLPDPAVHSRDDRVECADESAQQLPDTLHGPSPAAVWTRWPPSGCARARARSSMRGEAGLA